MAEDYWGIMWLQEQLQCDSHGSPSWIKERRFALHQSCFSLSLQDLSARTVTHAEVGGASCFQMTLTIFFCSTDAGSLSRTELAYLSSFFVLISNFDGNLMSIFSSHTKSLVKTAKQNKSVAKHPAVSNVVPGGWRLLREESPRREGVGGLPDRHDQIPDQTLSGLCPFYRSEITATDSSLPNLF